MKIRNVGRGPALHVRTQLKPGNVSPQNWSMGAVAPKDRVVLTFEGVYDLGSSAQVLFDYRDLSGRAYSSIIVLTEVSGDWRFYDVYLPEDSMVTSLGDAVYPQPGMEDVRPPGMLTEN